MPRAESIIRAITLFIENPRHPSLNIEKLKGSAVWTVRISRSNRLFFIWIDETSIMLVDVGIHDKYKQY